MVQGYPSRLSIYVKIIHSARLDIELHPVNLQKHIRTKRPTLALLSKFLIQHGPSALLLLSKLATSLSFPSPIAFLLSTSEFWIPFFNRRTRGGTKQAGNAI